MSGNQLTAFPWSSINSLTSLRFLYLDRNKLTSLPGAKDVLNDLQRLSVVSLSSNPFTCGCSLKNFSDMFMDLKQKRENSEKRVTKISNIECSSVHGWLSRNLSSFNVTSSKICEKPKVMISVKIAYSLQSGMPSASSGNKALTKGVTYSVESENDEAFTSVAERTRIIFAPVNVSISINCDTEQDAGSSKSLFGKTEIVKIATFAGKEQRPEFEGDKNKCQLMSIIIY